MMSFLMGRQVVLVHFWVVFCDTFLFGTLNLDDIPAVAFLAMSFREF